MLIKYIDLEGREASFNALHFVRARPTIGDFEPAGVLSVRLNDRRSFTQSSPEDLAEALRDVMPICKLHSPNSTPAWFASERVIGIEAPVGMMYPPTAKAVLTLQIVGKSPRPYAVTETVAEATEIVDASF